MADCPAGPDCITCTDFICYQEEKTMDETPIIGSRVKITDSYWGDHIGKVGTLVNTSSPNTDPNGDQQPMVVRTDDGIRLMCSAVEAFGSSARQESREALAAAGQRRLIEAIAPVDVRYSALANALRLFPDADDVSAMGVADWLLGEERLPTLPVSTEPVRGDADEGIDDYRWSDSEGNEITAGSIGYEDSDGEVAHISVTGRGDLYLSAEQAQHVISVLETAIRQGVDFPSGDRD